jgi:hypothetical protein
MDLKICRSKLPPILNGQTIKGNLVGHVVGSVNLESTIRLLCSMILYIPQASYGDSFDDIL